LPSEGGRHSREVALRRTGARRIAKQLAREAFDIRRRHLGTLMRRMGIEALYRKPRTSIPARQAANRPYLLSGLKIERPIHVRAADPDGARISFPGRHTRYR
jgi:hypothetical protein